MASARQDPIHCGSEAWLTHKLRNTLLHKHKLRMVQAPQIPEGVLVATDAVISVLEEKNVSALSSTDKHSLLMTQMEAAQRIAREKTLMHVVLVENKSQMLSTESSGTDSALRRMQTSFLVQGSSVFPYDGIEQLAQYVELFHVPCPDWTLEDQGGLSRETTEHGRETFLANAPGVSKKVSAQVMSAHSIRAIGAMTEDEFRIHHHSGLGADTSRKIRNFMNEEFGHFLEDG